MRSFVLCSISQYLHPHLLTSNPIQVGKLDLHSAYFDDAAWIYGMHWRSYVSTKVNHGPLFLHANLIVYLFAWTAATNNIEKNNIKVADPWKEE